MSATHGLKCDGCGKEDRDGKGWARIGAQSNGHYGGYQQAIAGGQFSPVPTSSIVLTGARTLQTNERIDLCSPECAGKWAFGA